MQVDTLILGAGAAGLFCAAHAGPGVLIVDHAKAPAEKIRISGGGRCNFTNLRTSPANFLSENPHFCKSALSRYTPQDFLALVDAHGIPWHEKTLGQLFCDHSAKDIIAMLLGMIRASGARLWLETTIDAVTPDAGGFRVDLTRDGKAQRVTCRHLVVATGGKSIPKMGATGLAYRIADDFGLAVTETRPALVPLTFGPDMLADFAPLAGVAVPARVSCRGAKFDEAVLFTHRGLSGPAILQISSYWHEGDTITLNLSPAAPLLDQLRAARRKSGTKAVATVLGDLLPRRLADHLCAVTGMTGNIADRPDIDLGRLADLVTGWPLKPTGSEGYRTAEVTLGGVATTGLSSRTMEATAVPGLFFIGECVDVTGWLGGYNFQWAWASAHAAGVAIAGRTTGGV